MVQGFEEDDRLHLHVDLPQLYPRKRRIPLRCSWCFHSIRSDMQLFGIDYKKTNESLLISYVLLGGKGGIRTHGTLAGTTP